jgi:uncharacterized protein DUF3592
VVAFVVLKDPNITGWKFFLLVPIFSGLGIVIPTVTIEYVYRKLKRNGVIAEGYITDHSERIAIGGGITHYYLAYNYEYNGVTYSLKEAVGKSYYRTMHVGDRVDVRCLPEHPTIARLYDRRSDRFFSDKPGKRSGAVV